MSLLASAGYHVVDVEEAVRLLREGGVAPRTIGLSFDDGYLDIAENALPVLEEHGFRATVFVATEVVEGRAPMSWYGEQPRLLSWKQIEELDRAGAFRFEAHSRTHPNLLALDEAGARDEIFGSKAALEDRLGRPVTLFSYPAGLFGERERRLVAEAGFEAAVSCEPGINAAVTDRYALRRRQIDARDRLIDFRAKVGGGHDTPPPLRGRYRRRYGLRRTPDASSSSW